MKMWIAQRGRAVLWMLWAFLLIPSGLAVEEMFCAGVGYDHKDPSPGGGSEIHLGMQSAGATPLYDHYINMFWGANHYMPPSNPATIPDRPVLTLRKIRFRGTRDDANGWLILYVRRHSSSKEPIRALAIWARSKERETVGQFVHFKDTVCGSTMADKTTILPCSATPINAVDNPSIFVYTEKAPHPPGGIRPPVGTISVNVLWKADFSYCNFPESFRFVVAINTAHWSDQPVAVDFGLSPTTLNDRKYGPLIYATEELTPKFYGAASSLEGRTFNCYEIGPGTTRKADWLEDIQAAPGAPPGSNELMALYSEGQYQRWEPTSPSCSRAVPFVTTNLCDKSLNTHADKTMCKAQEDEKKGAGFVYFGGRCTSANSGATRVYASDTKVPTCPAAKKPGPDLSGAKDFYDFVDKELKDQVKEGCDCPTNLPSKAEVEGTTTVVRSDPIGRISEEMPYDVAGEGCPLIRNRDEYNKMGLCKNSVAGRTVHTTRIWHSVAMLLVTQVLVPISCFMARFMKGRMHNPDTMNFHSRTHIIPINSWWMMHLYLIVPMLCLYLTSYSLLRQYGILGPSRHSFAIFHRTYGKAYFGVVAFEFLTGFLRPLNRCLRWCVIYLHWFCGYVIYIFGFVLCLLTYQIPASPFCFGNHSESDFENIMNHLAPMMLIGWFVVDTLYKIGVEIYLIRYDRSVLGVNAPAATYFPIHLPLPLDNYSLEAHREFEEQDKKIKRLFKIYIGISLVFFAVVVTSMLFLHWEEEEGFGDMECTHNEQGEFLYGLTNLPKGKILKKKEFCEN